MFATCNTHMEYVYPVKPLLEDTDLTGVIYHGKYLYYFERARTQWLEDVGYNLHKLKQENITFVVAHANIKFMRAIHIDESIEVVSKILELSPVSILYQHYIRKQDDKAYLYCQGEVKMVCVNMNIKPTAMPKEIMEKFSHE